MLSFITVDKETFLEEIKEEILFDCFLDQVDCSNKFLVNIKETNSIVKIEYEYSQGKLTKFLVNELC